MMPKKIYLCMKCRQTFEAVYKLTEILPLPGVPFNPSSKPCENCKKKRNALWYKIEARTDV